jgi:hypothetical protein
MPFAEKFTAAACAILALRSRLRWKPGSESRHLLKRLETAFPPTDVNDNDYVRQHCFLLLGRMREVMNE